MTGEEYLGQVNESRARIARLEEDLATLRQMAVGISGSGSGDVRRSPNRPSEAAFARRIERIDQKERALKEERGRLEELRMDLTETIEHLDRGNERTILRLHYLEGRSWGKIAKSTGYTIRWVYAIRKAAIISVEQLLGLESGES